jgi:predicted PurR-regulated permease PerM
LFERTLNAYLSILLAVIALYCATQVLQSILPFLVACVGVGAISWAVYAFVQYRRNRY